MAFSIDEIEIPVRVVYYGDEVAAEVALWKVVGLDDVRFPTKLAAEVAAQGAFPAEANTYARIYYEMYQR